MALPVVYPVNPVHPVRLSSQQHCGPNQLPIREIRTTARKNHAIPTRFLPQKDAKSTEIRTYGVFSFVRGMSVRGMEAGLVWIIPLTIIPLTSHRPCPSSVGHLHVHFGCGWPRWVIRGSILFGCGWPRGVLAFQFPCIAGRPGLRFSRLSFCQKNGVINIFLTPSF